mmetsp:Transcript_2242/g.5016  ORF Transcript_2242/g.5016 Transcript_2242/m.5016 type:complete len:280 (+) Transcript_2242:279-1118(+)
MRRHRRQCDDEGGGGRDGQPRRWLRHTPAAAAAAPTTSRNCHLGVRRRRHPAVDQRRQLRRELHGRHRVRRRDPAPHRPRLLPAPRLPPLRRRPNPHRAGGHRVRSGGEQIQGGCAGARRVLYLGGAGLAQVRLQAATAALHGLHPGARRHCHLPPARGPRHRPRQQNRGVRPAGGRTGHRGCQPRVGSPGRHARVHGGGQHPGRAGHQEHPAHDQQPAQGGHAPAPGRAHRGPHPLHRQGQPVQPGVPEVKGGSHEALPGRLVVLLGPRGGHVGRTGG